MEIDTHQWSCNMLNIIPPCLLPTFASHLDDQRRLEMSWKIWAKTGVLCEMSQLNATISIFPSHCILHNRGIGWLRFFFSILADTLYFLSRSESAKQFRFNFYIDKVVNNKHILTYPIFRLKGPQHIYDRNTGTNNYFLTDSWQFPLYTFEFPLILLINSWLKRKSIWQVVPGQWYCLKQKPGLDTNYREIFVLCQVRSLMNWGRLSFLHKQNNSDQLEIKTRTAVGNWGHHTKVKL